MVYLEMFYDVDILNRRGGKFGVIWLAANGKLRFKGKGSKNDLRLVLEVRIDRICQDIMRYVKIENPPRFPEEFRPSPSFSLFLAAKLAHGAIVVHHKQVTHGLAHVMLEFQQKTAQKKFKATNISCDVLDLSDAAIEVGRNLLNDCTLEEREFGRLAEVVDALRISSSHSIPKQTQQVLPCEEQLNHSATPAEIAEWFTQMEVSVDPEINYNTGIYASPNDITMKDTEPIIGASNLQLIEEFGFGNGEFINQWVNNEVLPPLEGIDDEMPGPSNLQRNNSKRVRNDENGLETVPFKQSRTELDRNMDSTTTEDMASPDMILEPVLDLPVVPRRGRRRRLTRLIIDEEIVIPPQMFQAQLDNYEDILRNKKDDQVIIEYQESTVHHIILLPSVERYQSPLIRELVTRNMKTKFVDSSNFNVVEDTKNARSNLIVAPIIGDSHTVACVKSCHPLKPVETSDNSLQIRGAVEVPIADVPQQNINTEEDVQAIRESPERLRNPNSRETSIIGSANTSHVNVSNASVLGRSFQVSPSHRPAEKRPNMQRIDEGSMESTASAQRFINETGRPGSQIGKPSANASDLLLISHEDVGNCVTFDDQSLKCPLLTNVTELPENEQISFPPVTILPQRESSYCGVMDPEPQALLNMIDELSGETPMLTFRQLVPPTKYSKLGAAKIFGNLLGLTKDRRINMTQNLIGETPYADIFISLNAF